jgi:hypothetical protein
MASVLSSALLRPSSNRSRLVERRVAVVEPGGQSGTPATNAPSAANERRWKGKEAMTAELFRTVSTCVAALFVSTMLVTAATSMPLAF